MRRYTKAKPASNEIRISDLVIDIDKRTVLRNGVTFDLTPMEFDLLKIMAQSPGRVYSRMQLLDNMQDKAYEGYERTIDSHIKNLRRKITEAADTGNRHEWIQAVYGVGYRFEGARK